MAKKIARLAVLTALALVFSWLEFLLPAPIPIPGVKLGLANLVTIFALYCLGSVPAATVTIARILLVGFLFGQGASIAYSLAGGVISLLVMLLLKRFSHLSIVGVSVAGGMAHNLAQLLIAMLIVHTAQLIVYLPVLLLCGLAAGLFVGMLGAVLVRRVRLPQ